MIEQVKKEQYSAKSLGEYFCNFVFGWNFVYMFFLHKEANNCAIFRRWKATLFLWRHEKNSDLLEKNTYRNAKTQKTFQNGIKWRSCHFSNVNRGFEFLKNCFFRASLKKNFELFRNFLKSIYWQQIFDFSNVCISATNEMINKGENIFERCLSRITL